MLLYLRALRGKMTFYWRKAMENTILTGIEFRGILRKMKSLKSFTPFVLMFSLFCIPCFGDVLIFKSGKIIHGQFILEESDDVRFRDESGTPLTVKKSFLDLEATKQANEQTRREEEAQAPSTPAQSLPKATTLAEVARRNLASRRDKAPVLTNADVRYGPVPSAPERQASPADLSVVGEQTLLSRVRKAESSFARLKEQCRSAGAESPPVRGMTTYYVGGKKVSVTGDVANPAAISHAKKICQQALWAQNQLAQARNDLARWQSQQLD